MPLTFKTSSIVYKYFGNQCYWTHIGILGITVTGLIFALYKSLKKTTLLHNPTFWLPALTNPAY